MIRRMLRAHKQLLAADPKCATTMCPSQTNDCSSIQNLQPLAKYVSIAEPGLACFGLVHHTNARNLSCCRLESVEVMLQLGA